MRERAREPLRRRGRVPCAGGGRARGPYALTRWLPPRRSASCARALRAAACSCSCAGRGRWPLRFGTCKTGSGHMLWRAVMWCIYSATGRGRSPLRPRRGRAARCVMDSPNAMRRAQWRAVAAVVGARSRLRPLVYGAAGASAAVDAGRCVYRTQAHAASTSEYFWVYLQVVVRLSVRYLEVNPQGLRYAQSGFVLPIPGPGTNWLHFRRE